MFFRVFYLNKKVGKAKMDWKMFEFTFHTIFATIRAKIWVSGQHPFVVAIKRYIPSRKICLILPKTSKNFERFVIKFMMYSFLNGVFGNGQIPLLARGDTLTTITTLLRQEISCQLNLFLPTKLAVYFSTLP